MNQYTVLADGYNEPVLIEIKDNEIILSNPRNRSARLCVTRRQAFELIRKLLLALEK